MDLDHIGQQLPIGQLGEPIHYFTSIGSTNDRVKQLAEQEMEHGGLVLADEQTAGRGRFDRTWFTPAGSALALSLLLRQVELEPSEVQVLNVIGALAVANALEKMGGEPQIKWPNDVLLNGKKVAGILVEASWREQRLDYIVIGIGVNVQPESVPPSEELQFPATSAVGELGQGITREALLIEILTALDIWLAELGSDRLVEAWNQRLAFRGQRIEIQGHQRQVRGKLLGVEGDGRIKLELDSGETGPFGDDFIQLRPVDRNAG